MNLSPIFVTMLIRGEGSAPRVLASLFRLRWRCSSGVGHVASAICELVSSISSRSVFREIVGSSSSNVVVAMEVFDAREDKTAFDIEKESFVI